MWSICESVRRTSCTYRGADKSLARPTSRCILFDGENISFDASLVIYINSTNIPPIMIINGIYVHQKSSVAVACFLPGRAKDLSALLYLCVQECTDLPTFVNTSNYPFPVRVKFLQFYDLLLYSVIVNRKGTDVRNEKELTSTRWSHVTVTMMATRTVITTIACYKTCVMTVSTECISMTWFL